MTVPLHGRLAQILREAWHRSRAWAPGVQLPVEEFADALLASEEWQAREAALSALMVIGEFGSDESGWCACGFGGPFDGTENSGHAHYCRNARRALARLDAVKGKEPDNAATVPLEQALAQAREIKALKREVAILDIAHDRADGALSDAATVPTGDLERGIRALTAERDRLKGDVKALAEALVQASYVVDRFASIGIRDEATGMTGEMLMQKIHAALARDGVRRGRGETG